MSRGAFLAAFVVDANVALGGSPVANHEISETIEADLRRAELLAVPLIVLLSFFLFRGFVASLLAPIAGGITVLVSFFLLRALDVVPVVAGACITAQRGATSMTPRGR